MMKNTKVMQNDFEYYLIDCENIRKYPLLIEADDSPSYQHENEYIDRLEELTFNLYKPITRKPKLADYHAAFNQSVISKKIYNALRQLDIEGVQFIPAKILDPNGEEYSNYWYLHVYNHLPALDLERSICKWNERVKSAICMQKIVLNLEFLKDIPLKKRLIFRLAENSVYCLCHQSVVDQIKAVRPEGIQFSNIREWELKAV